MNHKEIQTNHTNGKVIDLIHENYIDWMHACGKKGRCTSCKMIVISGMEHLSPPSTREKFYAEKERLKPDERLTCQTKLQKGTIKIRVAEENKFPHIDYSE